MNPTGRVVMVSGANRGLGEAIAERLFADGYTLSLGARRVVSLEVVTRKMDANRVATSGYEARDRSSAISWVASTAERFGRIDAVVNNAGVIQLIGQNCVF